MVRKLLAILCVACSLLMVACGGGGDTPPVHIGGGEGDGGTDTKPIELPDYDAKKDDLDFLIGGYFSPIVTEQSLQDYMDCGMDIFWINGNNVGYADSPRVEEALKLAEQKNVRCILDATPGRTIDKIGKSMICNDYGFQKYSSLWAVNAFDEPLHKQGDAGDIVALNTIAKYIPKFQSIYGKEMPFFVNMGPGENVGYIPDYQAYMQSNIDDIIAKTDPSSQRWISCDSYGMIYNPIQDRHYLKETWLYHLQRLADAKRDNPQLNMKSNFFLLSTPHKTGNVASYEREIGYNEMRIQMYATIAYGYDMVTYFTYATPPGGGGEKYTAAFVDLEGNKTPRWDAAQKLNNEVHAFDHVFMQFAHKGVYAVEGETDNYSNGSFEYIDILDREKLGELASVSASADTLIGVGEDEKGNSGYTVVNYNDPYYQKRDAVTMTFKQADHAIVYVNGQKEIKEFKNHTLELDLDLGEGVFVIPY